MAPTPNCYRRVTHQHFAASFVPLLVSIGVAHAQPDPAPSFEATVRMGAPVREVAVDGDQLYLPFHVTVRHAPKKARAFRSDWSLEQLQYSSDGYIWHRAAPSEYSLALAGDTTPDTTLMLTFDTPGYWRAIVVADIWYADAPEGSSHVEVRTRTRVLRVLPRPALYCGPRMMADTMGTTDFFPDPLPLALQYRQPPIPPPVPVPTLQSVVPTEPRAEGGTVAVEVWHKPGVIPGKLGGSGFFGTFGQRSFRVGEPLWIKATLRNTGTGNLANFDLDHPHNLFVSVYDKDGKPVSPTALGKDFIAHSKYVNIDGSHVLMTLAPGDEYVRFLHVDALYDMSLSGTYYIVVTYTLSQGLCTSEPFRVELSYAAALLAPYEDEAKEP